MSLHEKKEDENHCLKSCCERAGEHCADKLGGKNLHINEVTQPHCKRMEEVKRNEMERRAGGGEIAGLDMFVMFRA